MLRGVFLLAVPALLAGLVVAPGGAHADGPGCTWPASPGGQITFGVVPAEVPVGEPIGWTVEYDAAGESNFVIAASYDIDGPDGHHTVTSNQYGGGSYTPTAPGTYTVSGGWTETCGDGVTPDRTVLARSSTFEGLGPQPPYAVLFVQNGGVRFGRGRSPATAQMVPECPSLAPTEAAFTVRVRYRGRTVDAMRTHGCTGYSRTPTQVKRGRGWTASADYRGGRLFVGKGSPRTATLELLSGGATLVRYEVQFTRVRTGEKVAVRSRSCPDTMCQVIRIKRKDVIPVTG